MVHYSLRTVAVRERIGGPPSHESPRVRGNLWYGRPHLGLPWSIPVAPGASSLTGLVDYSTIAIIGKPIWGRLLGGGLTGATVGHRLGNYPDRRPVLPGSESLRKRMDTVTKEITLAIVAFLTHRPVCDYCPNLAVSPCAVCEYLVCAACGHPGTPVLEGSWVCDPWCLYWRDPSD